LIDLREHDYMKYSDDSPHLLWITGFFQGQFENDWLFMKNGCYIYVYGEQIIT
jgi:hypothetical protein